MMLVAPLVEKQEIVPKEHQLRTLEFLLTHRRSFNLSDMGTGKTLPAVQAIQLLHQHDAVKRVLVVAPLSVIRATWVDHMERFAEDVPVMLLDESTKRRKQVAALPGFEGIVLINPDGVKSVFHELAAWKPGLIVIDELSAYYRNMRTDRWKAMKALDHLCNASMWAMTATPVSNGILDSYAQVQLVNPPALPRSSKGTAISWLNYRDMLHTQPYPNVWVPKKDALEKVHRYMQPALRFTRDQVMSEVAEPVRVRKDVPLSKEQHKLLAELEAAGKAEYGDAIIKGTAATALITKVLQIATGSVYNTAGEITHVPLGPRLEALFDLRDEVAHTPIIVAVPFIHTAHRLRDEIAGRGLKVEVILGDTKMADRAGIVRRFQEGTVDFLLAHPKTLSHGVTLHKSHTVCWFGAIWDLELYHQFNGRIDRYGQKAQPLIVEFASTPLERKVYAALRSKQQIQGKFLELMAK